MFETTCGGAYMTPAEKAILINQTVILQSLKEIMKYLQHEPVDFESVQHNRKCIKYRTLKTLYMLSNSTGGSDDEFDCEFCSPKQTA